MDVINRLKSAVTTVLPVGNPITNEFEILDQRASGGPALLWKVYDGIQRSTKQVYYVLLTSLPSLTCSVSVDRSLCDMFFQTVDILYAAYVDY